MLYAAIDIHKRTFHAAVLDVDTGETVERRFGATREELKDWAMPLQARWPRSRSRRRTAGAGCGAS
jgi:hypothetical protein